MGETYLGKDRSSQGTRPVQPSLHRHEPSQYFVEFAPSVIFVNRQTV